jgi:hypothetical protein
VAGPPRAGPPSRARSPDACAAALTTLQREPQPLGDRPLIELGAGKRPPPPGTAEELWQRLRRERDEQVADLAGLSRNSKLVIDPASGHDMPKDNPALVAQAIEELVEAASRSTRLRP